MPVNIVCSASADIAHLLDNTILYLRLQSYCYYFYPSHQLLFILFPFFLSLFSLLSFLVLLQQCAPGDLYQLPAAYDGIPCGDVSTGTRTLSILQGIPSYAAGNWYRSPGAHCCKRTRNVRRENKEIENGKRMNKS